MLRQSHLLRSGAVFQLISVLTADQLGFSSEMKALATEAEGLVLVASPRRAGKSTLVAAFVDLINRQRSDYVITLERQIRLVHDNRNALVSQREMRGTADQALRVARGALRENPDVLAIEDLASADMSQLALEARGLGSTGVRGDHRQVHHGGADAHAQPVPA